MKSFIGQVTIYTATSPTNFRNTFTGGISGLANGVVDNCYTILDDPSAVYSFTNTTMYYFVGPGGSSAITSQNAFFHIQGTIL